MITLYGIKNCDTVKRARKALEARGIEHVFHDFRADGIDAATIQTWLDTLGADTVINRRGTTWRKLDGADQARAETDDAAALLAEQPALIKRPVFVAPAGLDGQGGGTGHLSVGLPKAQAESILDALAATQAATQAAS